MIDWVNLEVEYAMGEKSVEELAREYDTTVTAIETRAIDHDWPCEGIHSLTLLRQRLLEEYFVDFNITRAAQRAGCAYMTAIQAFRAPEMRKAVAARMRDIRTRNNITQDRIIAKMADIAFADIGALFDADGNLKPLDKLSEGERAMIEALEVVEGKAEDGNQLLQTKKVKLVSKQAQLGYLERLGKYKGMFNDKIEIEAKVETKEASDNDVARRLAFLLLKAARDQQSNEPKE